MVFFVVLLHVVTGVLVQHSLSVTCNSEGAWGIPFPSFILESIGIGVILLFFWQWLKETDPIKAGFWLLLVSAGTSNIMERLLFGCVQDFLSFGGLPLFNIADVVLSLSVVLLLWREFFPSVSRFS